MSAADHDGSGGERPARLAVVIITRDRATELRRTLRALEALPERPPVVVVDNGSTDGTAGLVRREFPSVRLLCPGRNLGAAGRNLAMEQLDVPYVAFCDDDTWWEPGALTLAAEVLDAHPDVAVVTVRILLEPGGRPDPINDDLRGSLLGRPSGAAGPLLVSFLAGASIVRRRALLEVGGFRDRLGVGGEEEVVAWDLQRAGWQLVHVAACVCHHQPSAARDPALRRRHGVRNALWTTWLRRPWPSALRRSLRILRASPADRVTARGVLDAAAAWRWVRGQRQVVPPWLEERLRRFDAVQFRTGNRSYR
ncbi:MAG: glycosyltransferase family 2 protein [Acidimicrobiia bacterium]